MLISYTSPLEMLVTTPEQEAAFLAEYFAEDSGRHLDDYDREEHEDLAIEITARLRAW